MWRIFHRVASCSVWVRASRQYRDRLPEAEALRVPVARVDAMVGLVGELVVQRSGIVERLERLGSGIDELDPRRSALVSR